MRGDVAAFAALLIAAPLAAEELPSRELLEFLGSFETAGGEWVDPTRLEPTVPPSERAQETPNEEESDE